MSEKPAPRVFNIAPGSAFLKTLVEALCEGTLIKGFKDTGDPMCLADVIIYVPTRRAARALRTQFAERTPSKTAILPTIRPLGEFEEDAGFFSDNESASLTLDPPIEPQERILELAKLVSHWASFLPKHVSALFGSDPLVLPSSAADAVWLARNLSQVMDEVARENGDWTALDKLVPDELAGWWQLTLEFMSIVSKTWPQYLEANALSDPIEYRNLIIKAETERLKRDGSRGPIIAAGSTGSVPATAELLNVIANLEHGAVVLPGLDQTLDEDSWNALSLIEQSPSVFSHPQYGLKQLLNRFAITRDCVTSIGHVSEAIHNRNDLVSSALMPADTTYKWNQKQPLDHTNGLANISEIVSPNEAQEAIAIAVALREAIEKKAVPAALVTTDRILARRVSAELERFGIRADDSGGSPLDQSPPTALFRLMLDVVFKPPNPVTLLSLLKHPLVCFGKPRAATRQDAESLELLAMRGAVVPMELQVILQQLQTIDLNREDYRIPDYIKRLNASAREGAVDLALSLSQALEPLMELSASPQDITVAQACKMSVAAFETIGRDNQGSLAELYAGDAGEAFAAQLRALVGARSDFAFAPHQWPSIFNALLAGQSVKPRTGTDPRIHIWGTLEARLQSVETVVLGGLNEKSWPARPSDDPLLSRSMKTRINIEPPERRVGLAAHDFQMLMGSNHVVLSRSARVEGAPSVASRWLQRLHARIGETSTKAMQSRAAHYLKWARQLDLGIAPVSEPRPCPTPALHLRPKSFNITEISTLRRDPYAIYAKHILGLHKLEPLLREPSANERGTLYHKILEEFVGKRQSAPGTAQELTAIGKIVFDQLHLPDETRALWWRRFEGMVKPFIDYEAARAPMIASSHVELSSTKIAIADTGVTLRGRADRIDLLPGGMCEILDYKTGLVPSQTQVVKLMEPQLPLEAAMLLRGGFFEGRKISTSEMAYVELRPDGTVKPKPIVLCKANDELLTGDQLAQKAWEKLIELVSYFSIEGNGYISRKAPFKHDYVGEYDHLARVAEWTGGGDEDGGEAP